MSCFRLLRYRPGEYYQIQVDCYSAPDVKSYMKMILEAVACCHEHWILHRDLKPNNFLVGTDHQLKLGMPSSLMIAFFQKLEIS